MTPALSVYLDAVRFAAALVVFLSHVSSRQLSDGLLWPFGAYGHQAVTVFFVLSGFVIAHAVAERETDARRYALSRLARLYSVALPAVLLTALLDTAGSALRPEQYGAAWGYVQDLSFTRFFTALTFSNQLWTLDVHQGSNAAYWSMGYEVPYYLVFGVALFAPARWRVPAVAAVLLALGPSIVALLPVWLGGVLAHRLCRGAALAPRHGLALWLGTIAAWLLYELLAARYGRPLITPTPLFKRAELLQDYLIGTLFVLHLVGFHAAAPLLPGWSDRTGRAVRWLAGASFTLYLCHLPIAHFILASLPWPAGDPRSRVLVFGGTLLAVAALAELTERRKAGWRRVFERVLPRR